ncbi:peptidase, partial [Escherichia coli]|nr:peptidase [Escherichia coli]EIW9426669.1 peptidase [Escherichia coli]
CNNTPAPLKTGVICGSVPESLTRQTPVPVLPQHMIWADVADWGDRLVDALDSCNADKAAIAGLERQRTARMNTHEK